MADKYPYLAALERHEQAGVDYGIFVRRAEPAFAIVAPHGGCRRGVSGWRPLQP